jgi:hypothetical protein
MKQAIFLIFVLVALTSASSAKAFVNCIRSGFLDNYRDMIHQVAVIDEDGRKTEEEYAQSKNLPLSRIQNRFAATGTLKCDKNSLTAQLTGASNVITTAAHAFEDLTNCKKRSNPEACTFTVKIGNEERTSKVSSLAARGTSCPNLPLFSDDWAVLKIDPPLTGIDFYQLPTAEEVQTEKDVIAVSAGARDFIRRDSRGRTINPKSIEDCTVKSVDRSFGALMFQSDCDGAQGSSGGSMLANIRGQDTLLGIASYGNETASMLERALKDGRLNKGTYKKGEWATYHVPVTGRFLRAIENATGGRSL